MLGQVGMLDNTENMHHISYLIYMSPVSTSGNLRIKLQIINICKKSFDALAFPSTPGKINMEPENTPLEKEKHLNIIRCLNSHWCSTKTQPFPIRITLPKTNSLTLKIGRNPKRKLVFQPIPFRSYLSFREVYTLPKRAGYPPLVFI